MTASQTRASQTTAIPRPRTAEDDVRREQPAAATEPKPTLPASHYPWPEPWRYARGARPRSEYWDVTTATWRSRGPDPEQRKG